MDWENLNEELFKLKEEKLRMDKEFFYLKEEKIRMENHLEMLEKDKSGKAKNSAKDNYREKIQSLSDKRCEMYHDLERFKSQIKDEEELIIILGRFRDNPNVFRKHYWAFLDPGDN